MKSSPVTRSADRLQADILSGTYLPGMRLPPERKLAAQYGVGRVSIRSALGKLTTAGLLEVRQGSGYRVRDYRRSGGPDLVATMVNLAASENQVAIVRDLLAVRRQFAHLVLTRLAETPPADLTAFRSAIRIMEGLIEDDAPLSDLATADLNILHCFVGLTKSDVLQLCVNPTSTLVSQLPMLQSALYASPRINVAAWTGLSEWLEQPSAALIPQFMRAIEARDRATVLRLAREMQETP